jgi:hypothetical protein
MGMCLCARLRLFFAAVQIMNDLDGDVPTLPYTQNEARKAPLSGEG